MIAVFAKLPTQWVFGLMTLVRSLFFLVFISASPSLFSESLSEVYRLATENDPVVAAAKANYQADDTIREQALARLLPTVTASYTWTENPSAQNPISGFFTPRYGSKVTRVDATQPLFNLQAIFGYRQALSSADQAFLDYVAAQQDLIVRTADAYFGVLRGEDNLASGLAEERAINRQLEQTQQRYEVGLIAITDVHEAQAAADLSLANRLALEAQLGISQEVLASITGEYINDLDKLAQSFSVSMPSPSSIDEWVALAEANSPELQIAESQVEAAKQSKRVATSAFAPTIDAFADWQKNRNGFFPGDDREISTFGVRANWELFRGGAKWAERKQAGYVSVAAQAGLVNAKRTSVQRTRSTYLETATGVAEVNARQRRIVSATSALDATQAGYDAGTRNIVDLLNAQRDLYAAQRDYANARYDYIINSLELKRAAGVITAEDLESIPTQATSAN